MFQHLKETTPTGLGCMCLVSIGAFLFGFDNGWWGTIQGAEAFLQAFGHCETAGDSSSCSLTASQASAGSSVQSAAIMVASIFAVYINKALGRKLSLVVTGVISIVGILIEITSGIGCPRFAQFVVGKTVASIAMGLCANIVPIYLSETSTDAARGFAINMYQNVQIIGYCLAAGVVYASAKRADAGSYLIPIGLQLFAPLLMILLSPLLPESPRWLVWNGRRNDAIHAASCLFKTNSNNFDAEMYVRELEIAFEKELAHPDASTWKDLSHGPDLRRLLISMGIQCWMQAQGSGYIINYMVSFLQDSGTSNVFPFIMGLNFVYYGGILTGHFLPDRYGRRPVVLSSTIANAAFMLTIASINTAISPATSSSGAASVAFLFLWQLSSGVMSPLIWIICTEAAPTRNRERVLSLAIFVGFGVSLMITSVSPYLQDKGYGGLGSRIGFIWGAASVLTTIWSFFMVPETKGLSLEQIDSCYEQSLSARKFDQRDLGNIEVVDGNPVLLGNVEDIEDGIAKKP
ncbi:general substrate transporter [Aspergillus lucknowensis]|uniref:General substrate transporter n=1 Tax=Aspergillus lucknowensis TaxID=176173 RepID=A0ABR4LQ38_9EURO